MTDQRSATTKTAVELLHRGWSVIPVHVPIGYVDCSCGNDCSWPGKHPRVSWRPYTEELPTEAEVVNWFDEEFYGSNIGVVTGRVSDMVVVDLDGTIADFEALGLPKTRTSLTGGGGYHFFYRIGRQPASSGISVTPGIDIKADGGFVVLPPSRHVSGQTYEWLNRSKLTQIDPSMLPKRVPSSAGNGEWVGELLSGVEEGERSSVAARMAGRYAQIGLTTDETIMLMVSWNMLNSPPLPIRELGATVRSVYKRHEERNETQIKTLGDLALVFNELRPE